MVMPGVIIVPANKDWFIATIVIPSIGGVFIPWK